MPAPFSSSSSSSSSSWIGVVAAATAVSVTAASYWMYESVSHYGWDGTLRLIWEGDAYTPRIRELVDCLTNAERKRIQLESLISLIEESLERARLSTNTTSSSSNNNDNTKDIILQLWIANFIESLSYNSNITTTRYSNLEKSLAQLSHDLDAVAALVDGVLLTVEDGAEHPQILQDLKRRKKLLSKQIVLAMERADALLASYQVLQEKATTTTQQQTNTIPSN